MRSILRSWARKGAALAALVMGSAAQAQTVPTVAAASDLKFALEAVAAQFQQQTGQSVRLVFGSSGHFKTQILQGAPFHLFMSADEQFVFDLVDAGKTEDRGRAYAVGRIGILVPPGSPLKPDGELQDLAAALKDGPYRISARAARTNRATQHWILELTQTVEGAEAVMATATVVTALRREVWHRQDLSLPSVPAPETIATVRLFHEVEWVNRYEFRLLEGDVPQTWDDSERDSQTRMWLRDAQGRALDLTAIASMSDAFYPRIWLRRAKRVPTGTVSLSLFFHASEQELAALDDPHVYGQARAQDFRHGFFDQTAHLWSRSGVLLVSAHQIVYYKE
jgi:hypothetical protein